ncbi:MAG: RIO1 family regulatory kinase/ATPase [Candidatus Bathyarchaeia archaeon]|nr:RIO1 family regulatory kinase/ATPase [Candidatus Bathyarchaeia archaeon]
MKKVLVITLEKLSEEPYASILCYPRPSKAELKKRLKELQKLNVKALEFSGEKQAFNTPVLGKGYVGIVVIAYRNMEKMAIKIQRVDAARSRMQQEAKMLKKANSVRVGPKLLGISKNFLLMQFIDGDLLPKWLEKRIEKAQVRKVLREVLEQCWRLDEAGLDHGELSRAPKHIIINKKSKPFIVDFETASIIRKPSNVTSICQFLFISGLVARKVAENLGEKDRATIIDGLRRYKNDRTRENFERVLKVCSL